MISSKHLLGLPEIAVGHAAMRGPCAGHSIQPSSSVAWAIQPWHFQGFGALGPAGALIMFPKFFKNMRQV